MAASASRPRLLAARHPPEQLDDARDQLAIAALADHDRPEAREVADAAVEPLVPAQHDPPASGRWA
jgi:hypothetical protein